MKMEILKKKVLFILIEKTPLTKRGDKGIVTMEYMKSRPRAELLITLQFPREVSHRKKASLNLCGKVTGSTVSIRRARAGPSLPPL